jgi:peptidoglycan/LPS O-acetylase OafA/YrhL
LNDVLFVGVLFVLMTSFDTAYRVSAAVLATVAFFLMLNGGGIFGLLHTKAAKFLGEVSYSIYLLHGFVITLFLSTTNAVGFRWTESNYWLVVLSMGLILVMASVITFRWIEQPFLKKPLGSRHERKNVVDVERF